MATTEDPDTGQKREAPEASPPAEGPDTGQKREGEESPTPTPPSDE